VYSFLKFTGIVSQIPRIDNLRIVSFGASLKIKFASGLQEIRKQLYHAVACADNAIICEAWYKFE